MIAERFESEARARIIWGDSPEQIIAHLRTQGATEQEAQVAVESVKNDRTPIVRAAAKKRILIGAIMMMVPVVSWMVFMLIRVIPLKLFAVTIAIGLFGAWKFVRGILGTVRPEAIQGDLSDDSTE